MIHIVKGFDIVNKAEIDVFLELSCFFLMPFQMTTFLNRTKTLSAMQILNHISMYLCFPGGLVVKNPPGNAGDTGSTPGLRGSQMLRDN